MAAPGCSLHLLDLSPDLLYRMFGHLSLPERLRLSLVCRRLRQLCAGASELWRHLDARTQAGQPASSVGDVVTQILSGVYKFSEWLAPRAAGVEHLRFAFGASPHPSGIPLPLPHMLLPLAGCSALPALRALSVDWGVSVVLTVFDLAGGPALPALTSLAFHSGQHLVIPEVEGAQAAAAAVLPRLEAFGLFDSSLSGALHSPWLPASLTRLCLSNCALDALPGALAHLPRLRSLTLDRNGQLSAPSFSVLSRLTALEDLNLSENSLSAFPHQVSQLTALRILYLHRCFADPDTRVETRDWEALRPLTSLAFLSISGNKLAQLPPVVAGMSHLQALHLEENEICELPVAPYLGGLRELLLDWKAAICAPRALRSATALSRLILNDHCVTTEAPPPPPHSVRVPAAGAAAEGLAAALRALPALRLVQDVLPPQDYLVITAPVARAMWELGRSCPHLEIGYLEGTYVGWTLADVDASLAPDPSPWP